MCTHSRYTPKYIRLLKGRHAEHRYLNVFIPKNNNRDIGINDLISQCIGCPLNQPTWGSGEETCMSLQATLRSLLTSRVLSLVFGLIEWVEVLEASGLELLMTETPPEEIRGSLHLLSLQRAPSARPAILSRPTMRATCWLPSLLPHRVKKGGSGLQLKGTERLSS